MREKPLIVSWLAFNAMREHRDHVLVRVLVEVVHLVALVEDVCHQIGRRSIDNGGRDDVGHVAEILVLGQLKLRVGVELSDRSQVDVAAELSQSVP
jgi:hypothetical protein